MKKSIWQDDDLPIYYAGREPDDDVPVTALEWAGVALVVLCLFAVGFVVGRFTA
jgi:hypothetical protein